MRVNGEGDVPRAGLSASPSSSLSLSSPSPPGAEGAAAVVWEVLFGRIELQTIGWPLNIRSRSFSQARASP
ncbi:hypothetical protein CC2G_012043 [Coprinopsis cinerea AmutBmut pab1-1]|nr:hypothetical protein CC2G_012043 [Coprinopsis cinerea AmutBmut pab1-1]